MHRERYLHIKSYWRANIRLIQLLLFIWAVVGYGCSILWVETLNRFSVGGLPLGFWFAQQGAIYIFVLLIFIYAKAMDKLDNKYDIHETP